MAEGLGKLNSGYFTLPYAFLSEQSAVRKPSRLRAFIQGVIFNSTKNEMSCKMGYSTFSEKLNCAKSSVSLAVSALGEAFNVMKKGMQRNQYEYAGDVTRQNGFLRVEYIFFTEQFKIERKYYKRNAFAINPKTGKKCRILSSIEHKERCLTLTEILVLSLVYSYTLDKRKKAFKGSVAEIAGKLDISIKAAEQAVAALLSAELIYRPIKGVNGNQKQGKYVANVGKIRALCKEKEGKKAKKEPKASAPVLPKEVQDINARADYARKEAAEQARIDHRIERLNETARSHFRFEFVQQSIKKLNIELAKAEVYEPKKLPALQERQRALQLEMVTILNVVGISVELYDIESACWREDKLRT